MSEGLNPFEPPKVDEAHLRRDDVGDQFLFDAKPGKRFVNLLLDTFIRFLMTVVIVVMFGENLWITLPFVLVYYLFFESVFGRTPAKWITKTKVVTENGGRPRFTQILGRTLSRFVPFEPFSFLGNERGWHDRWSGTRVVDDRRTG